MPPQDCHQIRPEVESVELFVGTHDLPPVFLDTFVEVALEGEQFLKRGLHLDQLDLQLAPVARA